MLAFLKSDLFLRFAGGFVLGTVGVVALNNGDEPAALTRSAVAAPAPAPAPVDATL